MLMPAISISLMCYEACKRILVEGEEDDREENCMIKKNGLCPCLRLTSVKTIHDAKHIPESQVCVGVGARMWVRPCIVRREGGCRVCVCTEEYTLCHFYNNCYIELIHSHEWHVTFHRTKIMHHSTGTCNPVSRGMIY
jgi:hypothetical protein